MCTCVKYNTFCMLLLLDDAYCMNLKINSIYLIKSCWIIFKTLYIVANVGFRLKWRKHLFPRALPSILSTHKVQWTCVPSFTLLSECANLVPILKLEPTYLTSQDPHLSDSHQKHALLQKIKFQSNSLHSVHAPFLGTHGNSVRLGKSGYNTLPRYYETPNWGKVTYLSKTVCICFFLAETTTYWKGGL